MGGHAGPAGAAPARVAHVGDRGAAVFLLGFRVGLNVEAPRGVIDVGLAGVVGASRILDGQAPYGHMPQRGDLEPCGPEDADGQVRDRIQTNGRCEAAIERGDTYGPVAYAAYVPADARLRLEREVGLAARRACHVDRVRPARRRSGSSSSASASAGRGSRALLAFAWAAYPFTAYALNANTNDTIMPAFLVLGFWLASSAWARGAAVALAGWAKFGALLLAPLWASYPGLELRRVATLRRGFRRRDARRLRDAPARARTPGRGPHVLGAGRSASRRAGTQPFSLWGWGQYHAEGIPDLGFVQPVARRARGGSRRRRRVRPATRRARSSWPR